MYHIEVKFDSWSDWKKPSFPQFSPNPNSLLQKAEDLHRAYDHVRIVSSEGEIHTELTKDE